MKEDSSPLCKRFSDALEGVLEARGCKSWGFADGPGARSELP